MAQKKGSQSKKITDRAICRDASSRRRVSDERRALGPVVYVDVNQRSVPVPQEALYDAASHLRLATEARVRGGDCASAVALVLAAMERSGFLSFCRS